MTRTLVAALAAAAVVAFFALDAERHLTLDELAAHRDALVGFAQAHPVAAPVLAFVLYAAGVALCLPGGLVFALACGMMFGRVPGTLVGVLAETAGASLAFVAARFLFADAVRARFGEAASRIDAAFVRNGFRWLVFLRAVPVLPYALVNIAPAVTSVRLATFALATLVAAVPVTFVYANLGDALAGMGSLDDARSLRTLGALGLVALLALVPLAVRLARAR